MHSHVKSALWNKLNYTFHLRKNRPRKKQPHSVQQARLFPNIEVPNAGLFISNNLISIYFVWCNYFMLLLFFSSAAAITQSGCTMFLMRTSMAYYTLTADANDSLVVFSGIICKLFVKYKNGEHNKYKKNSRATWSLECLYRVCIIL